jgi:hypothetical protein
MNIPVDGGQIVELISSSKVKSGRLGRSKQSAIPLTTTSQKMMIAVGWLSLRTAESGVQVVEDLEFSGDNDPAPVGRTFRPFGVGEAKLEIHNTGNIGFVLSDVRITIKRSKLTTDKRGIIAEKTESCISSDTIDVENSLFDVDRDNSAFRPVSVPPKAVTTVMLSFHKSANLPRSYKIHSVLISDPTWLKPTEGLLCAQFLYSGPDGSIRTVFQPLYLVRFRYDDKADTLSFELGPPFIFTRKIVNIF